MVFFEVLLIIFCDDLQDGGDLTFMNLLSDSPLKPPNHVSTASSMVLQTTPLFSESSRDSIMGRLDVSYEGYQTKLGDLFMLSYSSSLSFLAHLS